MSGIVGILNRDKRPVDRELLRDLTESMAFRGPDARQIWSEGEIGFGHAMLRTTREAESEVQPCCLDAELWITADARIDGRADLLRELAARGEEPGRDAPDSLLVLHAYRAWGEACVKHLIGDFAFGIWDGRRRQLFCARDQFGVKPFYYADLGDAFLFSNTLNTLRRHPGVSGRLNELAIADYLLFDFNQEPDTTTLADIRRLPPAHALCHSEGSSAIRRYWSLPIDEPLRFRRSGDTIDRFRELLHETVSDRLRTPRAAVTMSGGLDSTTVAAAARQVLLDRNVPVDLRAHTVVYDRLMPDRERHYSGIAARHLSIPIQYLVADDYQLYERWDSPEFVTPEPENAPLAALHRDFLRQVAINDRVALTGYGADPGLQFPVQHSLMMWRDLRAVGDWARLLAYAASHRTIPRIGLRTTLGQKGQASESAQKFPEWIDDAFATRLELRSRWERLNRRPLSPHPFRPRAYQTLTGTFWPWSFEWQDPGVSGVPVETRHPFFDLRLMRYMLALPPIPWCLSKELLRVAGRGSLPEEIRCRPKAPLAADPALVRVAAGQPRPPLMDAPFAHLHPYVQSRVMPSIVDSTSPDLLWEQLRLRGLDLWLRPRPAYDVAIGYAVLKRRTPSTNGDRSDEYIESQAVPSQKAVCVAERPGLR